MRRLHYAETIRFDKNNGIVTNLLHDTTQIVSQLRNLGDLSEVEER